MCEQSALTSPVDASNVTPSAAGKLSTSRSQYRGSLGDTRTPDLSDRSHTATSSTSVRAAFFLSYRYTWPWSSPARRNSTPSAALMWYTPGCWASMSSVLASYRYSASSAGLEMTLQPLLVAGRSRLGPSRTRFPNPSFSEMKANSVSVCRGMQVPSAAWTAIPSEPRQGTRPVRSASHSSSPIMA